MSCLPWASISCLRISCLPCAMSGGGACAGIAAVPSTRVTGTICIANGTGASSRRSRARIDPTRVAPGAKPVPQMCVRVSCLVCVCRVLCACVVSCVRVLSARALASFLHNCTYVLACTRRLTPRVHWAALMLAPLSRLRANTMVAYVFDRACGAASASLIPSNKNKLNSDARL